MPKLPKTKEEWAKVFLNQIGIKVLFGILTVILGYAWAQAPGFVESKVLEIVKPGMDSLAHRQEITDEKVDALIAILRKAFPQVEKAAKEKAADDAAGKEFKDALIGGSP